MKALRSQSQESTALCNKIPFSTSLRSVLSSKMEIVPVTSQPLTWKANFNLKCIN